MTMSPSQDGPRPGDGETERSHPGPEPVEASVEKDDAKDSPSDDEPIEPDNGEPQDTAADAESEADAEKAKSTRRLRRARPAPPVDSDDPDGPTPPWLQRGTGRRSLAGLSMIMILVIVVAGIGWLLFSGGETTAAETDEVDVDTCRVTEYDDGGLMIAPPQLGNASDRATATITTNFGDITVLLFGDVAPCGVSGFGYLASQGFYTNNNCYRITTQPAEPTVTLRCGDPMGTGDSGPGYRFRAEQKFEGQPAFDAFALINNENGQAGSNFAFVRGQSIPTASLSVIGQVIAGFEVLDQVGASAGLDSFDGVPPQQVSILSITIAEGTVTLPPTELPGTEMPSPTGTVDPSTPPEDDDPSGDTTSPVTGPSMPGIPDPSR